MNDFQDISFGMDEPQTSTPMGQSMQDIQDIPFVSTNDEHKNIIKVIGVGGGGGNAVNHMYREGIHNVNFVVVNLDRKALVESPIPYKLQLGDGLGAGNNPEIGRKRAEEGIDKIRTMLDDGTKMVFITAGMGGGTGTGAAPVVARCARELGILTVGIVTIPFLFEGNMKIDQALDGVSALAEHVDALIVVNNERLRSLYPSLTVLNGFAKADDTLSIAAKGIAEIITMRGIINLDFQDVTTILKDGGVALISTGYGEGEQRVAQAIDDALNSPLLNNNDVYNSKKLLLYIAFPEKEEDQMTIEEINQINDFMAKFENQGLITKWGMTKDATLDKKIKVTILAAGFGVEAISGEMQAKIEVKSEEARLAEAKVAAERARKRAEIYGEKDMTRGRKAYNIFIFNEDELDNENVISTVEKSPTWKRTLDAKNKIRHMQGSAPVQQESERISF